MRKKHFIPMIILSAFLAVNGLTGMCAQAEPMAGGWEATEDETVTEEDRAVFEQAMEGLTGVEYEPVALLATQLVAGRNYCFLCRGREAVPDAQPAYYYVLVYKDLKGNAEILNIKRIYFGLSDLGEEEELDRPEEAAEPEGSQPKEVSLDSLVTIGDVQSSGIELLGNGYDSEHYVCALELDGICYRFVADIPQDVSSAIWDMDFSDPDHDKKVDALLAPLEFVQIENLTETIPSQEELDAWIGKTGRDLLDDGWYISGYNLDEAEFWMNHGPYQMLVTFNEELEVGTVIDEEGLISPLTIKSVVYEGLGDVTNLE